MCQAFLEQFFYLYTVMSRRPRQQSNHARAATTIGFQSTEPQQRPRQQSNHARAATTIGFQQDNTQDNYVYPESTHNYPSHPPPSHPPSHPPPVSSPPPPNKQTPPPPLPSHKPTDTFIEFQQWADKKTNQFNEMDTTSSESSRDPDDSDDSDDSTLSNPYDSDPFTQVHHSTSLPPPPLPPPSHFSTEELQQRQYVQQHQAVDTKQTMHDARAVRVSRVEAEHANDVEKQRDLHRRYSLINVLDPSNVNAREQQADFGVVLPPSSWGDGKDIVRLQQRRHDHLRPITGKPALNGVFVGAANFVEHIDLGYANVAGAPPTKVKGETYSTGLPSDMPWGMSMGEDENRKGCIIVIGIADESPAFHMDIRPGDRLLGVEGNYFKSTIDMGMVQQAIGTFKRQRAETNDLVQLTFARETKQSTVPPPNKSVRKESFNSTEQHPVVAICETYAEELRRVFMAYALAPSAQVSNNFLTHSGSFDGRHFSGWGETRSLAQSGCMMNKIKIREFIQDFDLSPSLISMRAAMRILRHVLKQDYRGGDGVGAPLQLLVGGDARFMAAPSIHQPTPSQRQAASAELDKNHGVNFPEFIELLSHIADAACSRAKWEPLYPTTEDMLEGMFLTWGICDLRKLEAAHLIRQRKLTSVFRYN